jgi:hypothetical protein
MKTKYADSCTASQLDWLPWFNNRLVRSLHLAQAVVNIIAWSPLGIVRPETKTSLQGFLISSGGVPDGPARLECAQAAM